jgi:type II secretory pathway pseudopilin PulG
MRGRCAALALLEVVLAMGLFIMAAVFVMDALSASLAAVRRAEIEADGIDLASSVLAMAEAGALPVTSAGPEPSQTDAEFSWQMVVTTPTDLAGLPGLKHVEVIVKHEQGQVFRLAQLIADDGGAETSSSSGPEGEP